MIKYTREGLGGDSVFRNINLEAAADDDYDEDAGEVSVDRLLIYQG